MSRMMNVKIFAALFGCLLAFAAQSISAVELRGVHYAVYRGDVNSDGYSDIYLDRKPNITIIAANVIIPIAVSVDEGFLLTGNANGLYDSPVLNNSVDTSALTKGSAGVSFGDFDGDGESDLLVQGLTTGSYSVLVAGTSGSSAPSIFEQFTQLSGQDASLANATITMDDINADGYADFVISWSGGGGTTNLANLGSGLFQFVGPAAAPAPQIAAIPDSDPVSDAVGVTAGSFRVDESGSATYSIPIATAPGVAGVAPQISLNYSSQGGNGLVGRGWSISGLSAIMRCRKTEEVDGENGAVQFDTNDRLCLDGQRLVLESGTYLSGGSEYRTEIDSFTKIEAFGGSAGHPDYFVVWRKDGSRSEYGYTADSKIDANTSDTTYVWAQNKFEDNVSGRTSSNNPIEFTYDTTSQGAYRIESISYAKGDAEIEFSYASRTDDSFSYIGGHKFEADKRLVSITSTNDSQDIRAYNLAYNTGTHTNQSQLSSIQECSDSTGPAVCYPATTFNWANPSMSHAYAGQDNVQAGTLSGRPADLNGDGINELLWLELNEYGTSGIEFSIRISRWNGTRYVAGDFGLGGTTFERIDLDNDIPNSWWVLDYNNDGMQDVLYSQNNAWRVRLGEDVSGDGDLSNSTIYIGLAPQYDKTVLLADLDSDGMPDLQYDYNKARYLKRNPSGTAQQPYHFEPEVTLSGLPQCDSGYLGNLCFAYGVPRTEVTSPVIADFNGDGIVDQMRYEVYEDNFSAEAGNPPYDDLHYWTAYVSKPDGSGFEFYDAIREIGSTSRDLYKHSRVVDLNGDGLADLAYRHETANSWHYQLNTGDGFGAGAQIVSGLQGYQADRIQFQDMNGDGFPDLLYPSSSTMYWVVSEWNGNGFDAPYNSAIPARISSSANIDNWTTIWIDANGDGRMDAVSADTRDNSGPSNSYTYIRGDAHLPDGLITSITNGFGAETEITYKALSNPASPDLYTRDTDANTLLWGNESPVFDMMAPSYVVEQVASSAPAAAGSPNAVDANATSSVSYEYAGAKLQAGGRGFLGYREVTSIDDQTGVRTTTTYKQQYPFIGMPLTTEVRTGSGQLLSNATNLWADHNQAPSCGTGFPSVQPYLEEAVEKSYDLATSGLLLQTVTTETSVDCYGNALEVEVTTTDEVSNTDYSKATVNVYGADDVSNWILGRLTTSTVTHDRGDVSGSLQRKASFSYDSTTGLLETETVEPGGAPSNTLTTTYTHDPDGNVTKTQVTGWRGIALPNGASAGNQTRTAEAFFDGDRRYATSAKNALGHTTQAVLSRNRFGSPTAAEDIHGNVGETAYGEMGRQYYSRVEVGGFSEVQYRLCSQVSCPTGAVIRVKSNSAGGGEAYAYNDVLGREIRTAAKGFDGASYYITEKEYDELGRVKRSSEPFTASSPHTGNGSYWTEVTYDILGRVVSTSLPDSSPATTVAYNGLTTVTTNPLNQQRTEIKNALGELKQVTDDLGGTVTFAYDEQGNLAQTVQASPMGSITTSMGYDLLGRKTSMSDADMGAWSYAYNAFGELIEQTTAVGDKTRVEFDVLGRMTRRVDMVGGTLLESDSAWIYDTANSSGMTNGLGQLAIEDTLDGSGNVLFKREFAYDQYGRGQSAATQVRNDGTNNLDSYTQSTTYDQFGRVFQQFDASGDFRGVEYHYNAYGYLNKAIEAQNSGVSQANQYYQILAMDARGNVTQRNQHGVEVIKSYDAARGWQDSITATVLVGSQLLQDLSFSFDAVGNLTSRTDASRKAGGGYKNATENFGYDDLNRLLTVTGAGPNLTMAYDATGNIASKTGVGSYSYNSSQPHAVDSAGGTSYSYNANGSMTGGDGRAIQYSVFNKPIYMSKSGNTVDIAYGPSRDRFRRIDDANQSTRVETHYLGSVERIYKPGGVVETKRYIDGEVIVAITESGGAPTTTVSILLKDHLGSTHLLVSDAGVIQQATSFDAWGQRRLDDNYGAMSLSQILSFDTSITKRGFTGHEGLDPVGLIHMNGRVYDPKLGRFISADPFVQAPENTQSFNRYAYVWNNPLSYTDPSGYEVGTFLAWVFYSVVLPSAVTAGYHNYQTIQNRTGGIPTGSTNGAYGNASCIVAAGCSTPPSGFECKASNGCIHIDGNGDTIIVSTTHEDTGSVQTGWKFQNGGASVSFEVALSRDQDEESTSSNIDQYREESRSFRESLWPINRLIYDVFVPVESILDVAEDYSRGNYSALTVSVILLAAERVPLVKAATNIVPNGGTAGSIRNVNPTGSAQNCVNCSIATDSTLAGRPASALPGGPISISVLEGQFGGAFRAVSGRSQVESLINNAGSGARGIVFGARGDGVGHVFNVVNQRGTVRFLDGQTGKAASFDGFTSFQFLRTN